MAGRYLLGIANALYPHTTYHGSHRFYCQFEDSNYERLRVPLPTREGEERGYYDTLNEIKEGVGKLTSAHDNFLKTCSANGLDIYATESSLP